MSTTLSPTLDPEDANSPIMNIILELRKSATLPILLANLKAKIYSEIVIRCFWREILPMSLSNNARLPGDLEISTALPKWIITAMTLRDLPVLETGFYWYDQSVTDVGEPLHLSNFRDPFTSLKKIVRAYWITEEEIETGKNAHDPFNESLIVDRVDAWERQVQQELLSGCRCCRCARLDEVHEECCTPAKYVEMRTLKRKALDDWHGSEEQFLGEMAAL